MSASGIYSTFGLKKEATFGTFAAPDYWLTYNSSTLANKKTALQGAALHGGIYNLANRRSIGKWTADGAVDLDIYDRGMSPLFTAMLGASTSALKSGGTTTVYQQVFTPADTTAQSYSLQLGVPTAVNSIQAFSYPGSKVTDWTFDVKAGDLAAFDVSFDSVKEDTTQSYTSPSYVLGDIFVAAQAQLLIGGTASTTAGLTTISGGTAVPLTKSVSVKGKNVIDDGRYVLGSLYKQEQLINGFRTVSADVELDFAGLTQCYNAFLADTPVCFQLVFTGVTIDTPNSLKATVTLIGSACFFDADTMPVPGPTIISEKATLNFLDDGTNNPVQIVTNTLDNAILGV